MTSFSGLWNRHYGEDYSQLGTNTSEYNGRTMRKIAQILRPRGARAMSSLLTALTGAAVGGTASATHKRIDHPDDTLTNLTAYAGDRTINTDTIINRATVAGDETLIDALKDAKSGPTSYPVDASGNGGGGKVGGF